MLTRRKKVDFDYIEHQCEKLKEIVAGYDDNQVRRIQHGESTTRLSILFYGLLENTVNISEQTRNLLNIFREPLGAGG